MSEAKVYVYFLNNCSGYELIGDAIISGYEVFMHRAKTFLVEYDPSNPYMPVSVYSWDKTRNARITLTEESFEKHRVLDEFYGYMDNIPEGLKTYIYDKYRKPELDLEMEANSY